ncbi:hypothetical protein L6R52_04290 [Myxococcota bacterium]|nr:hypothetical protein [Myxococcota bacterium]
MRARTNTLALAVPLVATLACGPNETFPAHEPYVGTGPEPLPCLPNLDGKIEASELEPSIGPTVSYLVSPQGVERAVDLPGFVDDAGRRVWDWTVDLSDDRVFKTQASSLEGKWYASNFPVDAYTTPFDAAKTTDGIYRSDDAALWLLGVASREENPASGKTLLVYREPVALFRFPIQPGASWTSNGVVQNAVFRGLPYAGRDTYEVRVDAAGLIALPDLSFTQAHRVRTTVTIEPAAGVTSVQRQVSFLFECFGEVARATSRLNETNDDFTTATEIRRLGLE